MAITTTLSAELLAAAAGERVYPISDHGKVRIQYAKVTQGVAAGDDGSFVEFFNFPPGRLRFWPMLSYVRSSAFGASRVLKIGHRIYNDTSTPATDTGEAEDDDAFASLVDISAAANKQIGAIGVGLAMLKFDMYSRAGIRVFGTVTGGTIPAAATLELAAAYSYE